MAVGRSDARADDSSQVWFLMVVAVALVYVAGVVNLVGLKLGNTSDEAVAAFLRSEERRR